MTTYRFCGIRPQLAADVFMGPGAQVIGDVRLDAGVSIWSNAVLRGDHEPIHVGAGSNVQDGCILHTDPGFPLTLGAEVSIGHNAVLHGCTVGAGSVIGMNAVIMNGVVVGRASLVAAGSVLGSGQSYPDGSLISGNPAKVVVALSPEDREGLLSGTRGYAEMARSCLEEGVFQPCEPELLTAAQHG
ncbi:gamma carbonic anhydrase family protein [Oxalobacteraceae bacterium]|nr:gamma carbonic anhydrase family protein [Oxalobacteraceae bacterium]